MSNPMDVMLPKATEPNESWHWATVTQLSPLRVRLDGDTAALLVTPEDLVGSLAVNERVWVQRYGRRMSVVGKLGGVLIGRPDVAVQAGAAGNIYLRTPDGSFSSAVRVEAGAIRLKSPTRSTTSEVITLITSAGDPGIWFSRDGSTGSTESRIYADASGLALFGGTGRQIIMTNPILYSGIPSTTSGSANIVAASSPANVLYKTTSSKRNKLDIQDVESDSEQLLQVHPRDWWDRTQYEAADGDTAGLRRIPGLIAEELEEAGLDQFVTYEDDPDNPGQKRTESVMYDRLWTLLLPLVQQQQRRIEALEEEIRVMKESL